MKEPSYLSVHGFIHYVAGERDFPATEEYILDMPSDKLSIKRFVKGRANKVRIFDGQKEHSYMISEDKRNDEALETAKELRVEDDIEFYMLLIMCPIITKTKCRIDEGNGWWTNGYRYTYKDHYTEYPDMTPGKRKLRKLVTNK